MNEAMKGRSVCIDVGDEVVLVKATGGIMHLVPPNTEADVSVSTTRRAITRLADGETTLLAAVLDDEVSLRGDVSNLLAFHESLMAFLHGAVRSTSTATILDSFREGVNLR